MLCRICEEVVKSSELEEHSRLCSMTHNLGKQQTDCDLRLQKLAKALSDRRNENLRLKKAPSVPFFFLSTSKTVPCSLTVSWPTRSIDCPSMILLTTQNLLSK